MKAFNSEWKYETLAAVVRILQSKQQLVILSCCFAEEGQAMYNDL